MKEKIAIIIVLMLVSIGLFAGCLDENDTVVTEDTRGTLIDVRLEKNDFGKETIIVEFGNNSKAILSGLKRYDTTDDIDWYESLKPFIGKNVCITWYVNRNEAAIISIETIQS